MADQAEKSGPQGCEAMTPCPFVFTGWLIVGSIGFAAETTPEQLIEAGHWKRARVLVESRMREAPDDPLANYLLSQVRNAFGDRKSPLPLAERAVALDGRTAKYHRQVAEVLGVMAQHSGAVAQLLLARRFRREIDTALALDPRDPQAWLDVMEFYLLAPGIAGGDRRKADAAVERIMAIDSAEGFMAKARLAAFYKRNGEIEVMLRHAVEARPAHYRARVALARFYLSADRPNWDAAEQQAKEALKLDDGRFDAYAILAEVYTARAQWAELDSLLAAAAERIPDDLLPSYRAGERLLASGLDLPRAERYFRKYLAQQPEGNQPPAAEAHWKLGLALQKEGRTAQAMEEWNEAVRLDPESPAGRERKRYRNSGAVSMR